MALQPEAVIVQATRGPYRRRGAEGAVEIGAVTGASGLPRRFVVVLMAVSFRAGGRRAQHAFSIPERRSGRWREGQ
ncbi:hypothetical protein SL103_17955 [Streptomyces lydicus]|uniref:Uncharacterized protein n=1 Tax=Streptomyces lydicus TaxID=47763 RepID=A0A1D7VM88_9ACTN|nr:hypothetical protein SL103_17955 [Streptomyces lydicus]